MGHGPGRAGGSPRLRKAESQSAHPWIEPLRHPGELGRGRCHTPPSGQAEAPSTAPGTAGERRAGGRHLARACAPRACALVASRSAIVPTAPGARFGTATPNRCSADNPSGSREVTVTVALPFATPVTITVLPVTTASASAAFRRYDRVFQRIPVRVPEVLGDIDRPHAVHLDDPVGDCPARPGCLVRRFGDSTFTGQGARDRQGGHQPQANASSTSGPVHSPPQVHSPAARTRSRRCAARSRCRPGTR